MTPLEIIIITLYCILILFSILSWGTFASGPSLSVIFAACLMAYLQHINIIVDILTLLPLFVFLILPVLVCILGYLAEQYNRLRRLRKLTKGNFKAPCGQSRDNIPKIFTCISENSIEIIWRPGLKRFLKEAEISREDTKTIRNKYPQAKVSRITADPEKIKKLKQRLLYKGYLMVNRNKFKRIAENWLSYIHEWAKVSITHHLG